MKRNKILFGILITIIMILVSSNVTLAKSIDLKDGNNDLSKTLEPGSSKLSLDEYLDSKESSNEIRKYFDKYTNSLRSLVGESTIPSKFNLSEHIKLVPENQGSSNWCWAYAGLKSIETNLQLKESVSYNFSEAHVAYMTSKDLGGKRKVNFDNVFDTSSNFIRVAEYLGVKDNSKTSGPVLETSVPDKEYQESEINKIVTPSPVVKVNSIEEYPNLILASGKKSDSYSQSELDALRTFIKKNIMNNGSLYASICIPNGKNSLNMLGNNYSFCNIDSGAGETANHAVSIVGWDDSYSKDNFDSDNRPEHDGAYIALNSWGSDWGNKGYFYISYEDAFIESTLYGINDVSLTYEDKEGPATVYSKDSAGKVKVNVYDIGGSSVNLSSLKYAKSDSPVQPNLTTFTSFTNETSFDMDKDYLWIYSEDAKGNKSISCVGNVYFKDANLYSAMKNDTYELINVIGSNDTNQKVLIGNIENVSYLILLSNNISDISGLEAFTNLNELYLSNNNIVNISPLTNLKGLENLYIANNKIANISALNNLVNLKQLELAGNNEITDISALQNLTNLKMLNLVNCNAITNISIVGKLINLTDLSLDNCNIQDIRFIGNLTKLTTLSLSKNKLTNIDPIGNIISLRSLDISYNGIGRLNAVSSLENLVYLYADSINLTDISPVSSLSKLDSLSLSYNEITDCSAIISKPLTYLNLNCQDINITIYPTNSTSQVIKLPEICEFIADRVKNHGETAKINLVNATAGSEANTIVINSTDTSKNPSLKVAGGCCNLTTINYNYNKADVNVNCTNITTNQWEKVQKVKVDVTASNNTTIKGLQYVWSNEKTDESNIKTAFTNGATLATPEGASGEYYLCILVTLRYPDDTNSTYKHYYGKVCVDNIKPNGPQITGNVNNEAEISENAVLNIGEVNNTLSGIKEYQVSLDNGATWQKLNNNIVTCNKVGNYILIARAISNTGVIGENSSQYKFVIKSANVEVANISYSTTESTNQDVVATINFTDSTIKVTNNNGSKTYTFTQNGTFIFEYEDSKGNKGIATATVNNIRKAAPVGSIIYSGKEISNRDVEATLTFPGGNDGITVTNNGGSFKHTFTENGEFTFEYKDQYGNTGKCDAKVENIDKTPSEATFKYSTLEKTNGYVTVEVSFEDPGVVITNNNGDNTHVFAENGEFTFEYIDTLGNIGSATAKVENIDKETPIASIEYSTEEPTKDNVEVEVKFNKENVEITNNRGFNKYTFKDNGSFTFEYKDAAGNEGKTTVDVNNIDRTISGASKLPDTGLHLVLIFGAILIIIARVLVAHKDELEKVWILYKNRREFNHSNNR